MKILIADDSVIVRENLKKLISRVHHRFEFLESGDVEETREILKRRSVDLLILDLKLPGGSGFDVLQYIKDNSNDEKRTIAVLTNYATQQHKKRCFELGADYVFDKSFEFVKVLALVGLLLDKQSGKQKPDKKENHS